MLVSDRTAPPSLPVRLADRPEVHAALTAVSQGKVTAVVAGPGWGKTTSVHTWAMHHEACWLTVDTADESVERLCAGLLTTLRGKLPALPAELVTTSGSGDGPSGATRVEAISALLCRLLDAYLRSPLVLVIDDLHKLAPGSNGAGLIEKLCRDSPQLVRLVLISRTELALFAELPELGRMSSRELAFSEAELAGLLTAVAPDTTGSLATTIHQRTAGWTAAVMVYLDAVRGGRPPALDGLDPLDAYLLGDLVREVVAAEPEPVRSLLHTVAVLGRASTGLCVALGHVDAAVRLPELAHRGLLAAEPGTRPQWTVREPVRAALSMSEEDSVRLRRAAARACEELGAPAEALRHLLAAGLVTELAELLMRRDEEIIAGGDASAVLDAVAQVRSSGNTDSRLHLIEGFAHQYRGDFAEALRHYLQAGTGPTPACLAWRMGQLYDLLGQPELAVELASEVPLSGSGSLDEIRFLAMAATWLREQGDQAEATRLAGLAAQAAPENGSSSALAWSCLARGRLAARDGNVVDAHMHYRTALGYVVDDPMLRLSVRAERAALLADPADTLTEIDEVLRDGRELGVTGHEPACHTLRARALSLLARYDEALAELDHGAHLREGTGLSRDAAEALFARADVHRRRGEPGQARALLEQVVHGVAERSPWPVTVRTLAALARVRAADDLLAARAVADDAVNKANALAMFQAEALLARGWVALLARDLTTARQDAALTRELVGRTGDRAGLADALQLAAFLSADPKAAERMLEEAGSLCRMLGDRAAELATRVAVARLTGASAGAAEAALAGLGVRVEAGMADLLGAGLPRPSRLAVRTQGALQVLRDGEVVPAADWQSKKARDLIKILIAHRGRPVARGRLIELLWPETMPERGGNRLSVLLSTLRAVLSPGRQSPGADPIVADRHAVSLDLSVVEVDVERFLTAARAALAAHRRGDRSALALLAAAEDLCTSDFFAEDQYEDWATGLREEVRAAHVMLLRTLARHVPDADQRVRYLLLMLDEDPHDEGAHLDLIRSLRDAGRYGEVARRYALYAARMREIDVRPVSVEQAGAARGPRTVAAG
jgi:ATP/maltotriose-dependent transcriptional regulator MalT/DNA-binding SARP family transcriptional activator